MIAGATGMTGGLILNACLDSPEVGKVTSIVRRSTGISNDKLTEVIHHDFNDFTSIASCFENQDVAYYCVGVYTGSVNRDMFRVITVDYTEAFAKTLKRRSPRATFCFLSGMGADRSERSRMVFAKDKGVAENRLDEMQFHQLYIFRPAYIYPATPRKEPNITYRIMRFLYPLFKRVYANGVITSTDLSKAMFVVGLKGEENTVLENKDIKKVADASLSVI